MQDVLRKYSKASAEPNRKELHKTIRTCGYGFGRCLCCSDCYFPLNRQISE